MNTGHIALVACLCIAHVTGYTTPRSQLPCAMFNNTGGFPQTGPVGGTFIDAQANVFQDAEECNQYCCVNADKGCRAAWFYTDRDMNGQPRTVCQLWNCNPCNTIAYHPDYHSIVSIMDDDRPNPIPIPNMGPSDPNVLANNAQGYPDGPPQDQGIYPEAAQGIQQDQGAYGVPQDPAVYGTQDQSDIPQSVDQQAGLPQPVDSSQGQWVYNPATGEYTFVSGSSPDQAQGTVDGVNTAEGIPVADTGYQLPSSLTEGEGVMSEDPLVIDYEGLPNNTMSVNASESALSLNETLGTTTESGQDWWDWWPFGGNDDETEEEQEKEEEEWEKEWEEEEEEEEKEWEEEMKEFEDGRTTQFPYSSTESSTLEPGDDFDDEDDEEWMEEIQGLQEQGAEEDQQGAFDYNNLFDRPEANDLENDSQDSFYKPPIAQTYAEDDWAVNAPVIAVGACAAVILVLLLLVLLGKKLAGKNDRAQYKPLRESFSGSSTYHEDI